jgi:5-methylcytosine-specific restriction endonuclease McrA
MRKAWDGRSEHYFCCNVCKNSFYRGGGERGVYAGHNGKSGISKYRKVAFNAYDSKCHFCGYNKHSEVLQVYHKDKNRKNNELSNLEIVCPTCHAERHMGFK